MGSSICSIDCIDWNMISKLIIISLIYIINLSTCFKIVGHTQNAETLEPGQTLQILCTSGSYWEYCVWTHTSPTKTGGLRECEMEWKRGKRGVVMQQCDDDLINRTAIAGDYTKHECGLTVTKVGVEDAGDWECQMEEYKFTDLVSGMKDRQNMSVKVEYRAFINQDITMTIIIVGIGIVLVIIITLTVVIIRKVKQQVLPTQIENPAPEPVKRKEDCLYETDEDYYEVLK